MRKPEECDGLCVMRDLFGYIYFVLRNSASLTSALALPAHFVMTKRHATAGCALSLCSCSNVRCLDLQVWYMVRIHRLNEVRAAWPQYNPTYDTALYSPHTNTSGGPIG